MTRKKSSLKIWNDFTQYFVQQFPKIISIDTYDTSLLDLQARSLCIKYIKHGNKLHRKISGSK